MASNWKKKAVAAGLTALLLGAWWFGLDGRSEAAAWHDVIQTSGASVQHTLLRASWRESGERSAALRRIGMADGRWRGYDAAIYGEGEAYVLVVTVPYAQIDGVQAQLSALLPDALFARTAQLAGPVSEEKSAMERMMQAAGLSFFQRFAEGNWESVAGRAAPGGCNPVQLVRAGRGDAVRWYVGMPCVFIPY